MIKGLYAETIRNLGIEIFLDRGVADRAISRQAKIHNRQLFQLRHLSSPVELAFERTHICICSEDYRLVNLQRFAHAVAYFHTAGISSLHKFLLHSIRCLFLFRRQNSSHFATLPSRSPSMSLLPSPSGCCWHSIG